MNNKGRDQFVRTITGRGRNRVVKTRHTVDGNTTTSEEWGEGSSDFSTGNQPGLPPRDSYLSTYDTTMDTCINAANIVKGSYKECAKALKDIASGPSTHTYGNYTKTVMKDHMVAGLVMEVTGDSNSSGNNYASNKKPEESASGITKGVRNLDIDEQKNTSAKVWKVPETSEEEQAQLREAMHRSMNDDSVKRKCSSSSTELPHNSDSGEESISDGERRSRTKSDDDGQSKSKSVRTSILDERPKSRRQGISSASSVLTGDAAIARIKESGWSVPDMPPGSCSINANFNKNNIGSNNMGNILFIEKKESTNSMSNFDPFASEPGKKEHKYTGTHMHQGFTEYRSANAGRFNLTHRVNGKEMKGDNISRELVNPIFLDTFPSFKVLSKDHNDYLRTGMVTEDLQVITVDVLSIEIRPVNLVEDTQNHIGITHPDGAQGVMDLIKRELGLEYNPKGKPESFILRRESRDRNEIVRNTLTASFPNIAFGSNKQMEIQISWVTPFQNCRRDKSKCPITGDIKTSNSVRMEKKSKNFDGHVIVEYLTRTEFTPDSVKDFFRNA